MAAVNFFHLFTAASRTALHLVETVGSASAVVLRGPRRAPAVRRNIRPHPRGRRAAGGSPEASGLDIPLLVASVPAAPDVLRWYSVDRGSMLVGRAVAVRVPVGSGTGHQQA
ncbi:hypothetical protein GCM10010266_05230 [Streptomyces griseomycini]|nr:hypothetical protein GCM10010266_05230 [Streptomyces griseomycini]GGR00870.1 hypothetical protein GCM10015536_01720 [Streptomyces griseomycini]